MQQRKFLFSLLLIIISLPTFGEIPVIKGKVIDTETGLPIENVNVFIAQTFLGSSTDKEGNYVIKNVLPGRYTLIFSHLSYVIKYKPVQIGRRNFYEYDEKLNPKSIVLPEISVVDEANGNWNYYFDIFKRELIGFGDFAKMTEIINPFIVDFDKNEQGNLVASCDRPLIVENKALGYRILYFLKYFEYAEDQFTKYSGVPVFDTLTAENEDQHSEWKENRKKAYNGSLRHFLTAMSKSYELQTKDQSSGNKPGRDNSPRYISQNDLDPYLLSEGFSAVIGPSELMKVVNPSLAPLYPENLLRKGLYSNELVLAAEGNILVEYTNEYDEKINIFNKGNDNQISTLRLHSDEVVVDKKGRYYDEFMIQTQGYWSKERLCDMVPFEYEPHKFGGD